MRLITPGTPITLSKAWEFGGVVSTSVVAPTGTIQPPGNATPIPVTLILTASGLYQAAYTPLSNAVIGVYDVVYTGSVDGYKLDELGEPFQVAASTTPQPIVPGSVVHLSSIWTVNETLTTAVTLPHSVLQSPDGSTVSVPLVVTQSGVFQAAYTLSGGAVAGSWGTVNVGTVMGIQAGESGRGFDVGAIIFVSAFYCSYIDVQSRFTFLQDKTQTELEFYIALAQSEIDATLASAYPVPFAIPAPPYIRMITIIMAAWHGIDKGLSKDKLEKVAPSLERMVKMTSAWLSELRTGTRSLPGITALPHLFTNNFNPHAANGGPEAFDLYSDPFLQGLSPRPSRNPFLLNFPL